MKTCSYQTKLFKKIKIMFTDIKLNQAPREALKDGLVMRLLVKLNRKKINRYMFKILETTYRAKL